MLSSASVFFFGIILLCWNSSIALSFPELPALVSTIRRQILINSSSSIALIAATTTMTSATSMAATATSGDSPDKPNIRWGIIGLGDVCQKKSGPAFWKCDGSELVAVMRRTPERKAVEFAERVPGGNCVGYDNIDEFLNHPDLDAVYVSTRPGTQVEICQKVAAAGKHCYVEKPVGRCSEETQGIIDAFSHRKDGRKLYTAYISRAYERTQKLRRLLYEEKVLGDRCSKVTYKLIGTGGARDMGGDLPWRLDAEQSGGGLIMDVGCHAIDRIDYVCNGPLVHVSGVARNRNSPNQPVEDYVSLMATIGKSRCQTNDYCSGASIECTWDFASSTEEPCDELRFIGPNGSLLMAGMSPNGSIQVLDKVGNLVREITFDMPEHTAQRLIQATTDDLRGIVPSNPDCLSVGDNAIRTQKVLDAVLDTYYGGREIGYWSRAEAWSGRKQNTGGQKHPHTDQ